MFSYDSHSTLIVGIADCQISSEPHSVLLTHALGSCIAVMAYDPVSRIAGLLHFMLPDSSIDKRKGEQRPFTFADTGIAGLLQRMCAAGAERKRILIRVVGGAQMCESNSASSVGKRNYLACRKVLWSAGLLIQAEEIGGVISRNVRVDVESGRLWWKGPSDAEKELVPLTGAKVCPSGF